jgi:hypothetical protein
VICMIHWVRFNMKLFITWQDGEKEVMNNVSQVFVDTESNMLTVDYQEWNADKTDYTTLRDYFRFTRIASWTVV